MLETLSEVFARFARYEFHDSSPLYARFSTAIAQDSDLLALAAHCREGERIPNLFFAAVHYLLLAGISHSVARFYQSLGGSLDGADDPFPDFRSFCLEHAERIREIVNIRLVQTNEVSRCAGLMPVFVVASKEIGGRPLYLVDIGASAGLNLFWDHYGYQYGDRLWGGERDSPVQLECALKGPNVPPLPTSPKEVAARVGVDLSPLNVRVGADALWLRALIWPEHVKRAQLLGHAMDVVRRQSLTLIAGDGVELLPAIMNSVPADAVLGISRIFTQIPASRRERWLTLIADYGAQHDLVLITARPHGPDDSELVLTSFVNGRRNERSLAYMQNHGNWIEWLSAE